MDGTTFGLGVLVTGSLWSLSMLAFTALLLLASVIDARSRRFPNALAAAMAALALAVALIAAEGRASRLALTPASEPVGDAALALMTLRQLAVPLACAAILCAVLFGFELLWRRARGSAGLGMGDVKLLFALVLADPARGVIAFAGGLALLALACLASRKASLPLIPFVFPAWVAAVLIGPALPLA